MSVKHHPSDCHVTRPNAKGVARDRESIYPGFNECIGPGNKLSTQSGRLDDTETARCLDTSNLSSLASVAYDNVTDAYN